MKRIHWMIACLTIGITVATASAAPKKKKQNNPDKWKIADETMWKELQTKRTASVFQRFDADKSNTLDRVEFEILVRGSSAKGKGRKNSEKETKPDRKKNKKQNVNAVQFVAAKAPNRKLTKKKKNNNAKGKTTDKGLGGAGVDRKKWLTMGGPNRLFDKLDKDKDNELSKSEFVTRKDGDKAENKATPDAKRRKK